MYTISDTHSIKTVLLDLPSVGSKVASRKAPASYTKIVVKGMTRAEMTLKVVMSQSEPINAFVEQYFKLLPEADASDFNRVLDMKSIKKVDQPAYIDYYNSIKPLEAPNSESHETAIKPSGEEESRIKKLEKLIKKRL